MKANKMISENVSRKLDSLGRISIPKAIRQRLCIEDLSEVDFYNKVIEKKITIVKKYGEENNMNPEKNIDFDIYDIDNNLIKTISTDENGEVTTTLPYGKYKIVQKNTTEGYQKNEPFIIIVDKNDEETIELKDYRIPVPNTYTNIRTSIIFIIIILLIL